MSREFADVFETELKAVRQRRGNVRPDDASSSDASRPAEIEAFPPISLDISPDAPAAKDLEDAFRVLKNPDQDALWDSAVREAEKEPSADDPEDKRTRTGHRGLIGLALSGGGIRSATYNLGIIQALERCGLWKHIDYLSTVSGGGYIGSCLSSLYTSQIPRPQNLLAQTWQTVNTFVGDSYHALVGLFAKGPDGQRPKPSGMPDASPAPGIGFPFRHTQGTLEPETFRHLRDNANYIAPHGLLDYLRPVVVLLRGIVVNVMIVLPYILVASAVTILLHRILDTSQNGLGEHLPLSTSVFPLTLNLLLALTFTFMAYPFVRYWVHKSGRLNLPDWDARELAENILAALLAVVGAMAFIELQPLAIRWLDDLILWFPEDWKAVIGSKSFSAWLGGLGTVTAALSAHPLARASGSRRGKIGLYALGFLGFVLLWLLYLNLCRWALYDGTAPGWLTDWSSATVSWTIAPLLKVVGLTIPDASHYGQYAAAYAVWAALLAVYSLLFFDLNSSSLHNFYRDRLSKAYLIRIGQDGKIEHNDTQRLSDLNTACAPYHLINAAINVKNPEQDFRRGRMADTFTFSANHIGGPLTGYCKTKAMEQARPHVNLGTAMAISGAAFAATAGKATIRPLAFLLAMLNVRLNYWLPNPRNVKNRLTRWMFFKTVGPLYLIWELLGRLRTDSWNVDISDGGHFENLGVYELLRRECRLIIVGDGECDPKLKFEAVSELVRLAQIDLGIWIEVEGLDAIRAGRQHHAIGTIHYSGGRIGKMLYLKSSMLKDDNLEASLPSTDAYLTSPDRDDDRQYDANPYIAHYKSKHPDFPHQTTADQFFDERQFECYRALGYMVGMRTCGRWKNPAHKPANTAQKGS